VVVVTAAYETTTTTTTVGAEETKEEHKARLKAEKAAEKQAKKDAKAQAKLDKQASREAPPPQDSSLAGKWERYNQLRANVRRRRVAYGLIIVFAILVFAGTLADIIFNESEFKLYLLTAYAVLFVWGLILLFSRRRHLQEVAELAAMQRTYLECENCNSVFQFGQLRFGDRRRVGFTCPVCGDESALPGPGSIPVERVLPEANVTEVTYACGNCSEEIVVGAFGATPVETRFRACPHCGVAGQVSLA
jgi:DNA-directed RNA polymerase subunit M/transcription elongation factor TFIIS/DNA-directed RNA polymerase subunit RPC12/RpoP